MPSYEYKCEKCGAVFETLRQKEENKEKVTCPHCGGKECQRVYSFSTGQQNTNRSTFFPT